MNAISKFHHYFPKTTEEVIDGEKNFNEAYIFIKVNKDQVKIFYRDILFIESIKDYVKIVTALKTYITYDRLMYMEEKLPEGRFLRIHKSYIVSLVKVKSFRNDHVMIGERVLPIGRVYKQRFIDAFAKEKV